MHMKEIGNKTFKTEKMASTDSLAYLIRIGKLMEGIEEMLEGGEDEVKLGALLKFMGKLDGKEAVQLVNELATMTWCDDEKTIPDQHIDGVAELAQVCIFVIEVNYGDFFGAGEGTKSLVGQVKNFSLPK